MYAVIADIHANLEARETMFAHMDALGTVSAVFCRGDFVKKIQNSALRAT